MAEITNQDRSTRALQALHAYDEPDNWDRTDEIGARTNLRTGEVGPFPEQVAEVAAEVVSDLLCDLQHLCDVWGLTWRDLVIRGERHHDEEVSEED